MAQLHMDLADLVLPGVTGKGTLDTGMAGFRSTALLAAASQSRNVQSTNNVIISGEAREMAQRRLTLGASHGAA